MQECWLILDRSSNSRKFIGWVERSKLNEHTNTLERLGFILQSNLPSNVSFLFGTTISIISNQVVFKMYREWSTIWLQQPIVVKVWYRNNWFFLFKEELWIGNMLVDRNQIGLTWLGPDVLICERLAAPVSIADQVYYLEVLITHVNYRTYYCNISLDGEVIGGDVEVKIPRTDLTTLSGIHRRGFRHFMFDYMRSNILKIVFRVAAFTIFLFSLGIFNNFMRGTPITWELTRSLLLEATILIAPLWLFAELWIGFLPWQTWEKFYADTLAHQRKLDAPPVRLDI
jgi:hypothetical protein